MYSRRVTAQTIAATNAAQGWDLQPRSAADISAAIAHFEDLMQEDGSLARPLTAEEVRFIQNERKLCALDFEYWVSRYAWIVNKEKRPEVFKINIAQQILLQVYAEFEDAGRAIHIQHLKARRLGVSTFSELAVQHRFQFCPYSNCVVASASKDKSKEMADMMMFCYEQQPWWLISTVTEWSQNMPAAFGEIHTSLTIQAGNQVTGVARGATPSAIHLSELAEFRDGRGLVDASLYKAIIDTPDIYCVLEGTGEGIGNWWHESWVANIKSWDRGRGRVRPVFLPWFVGVDLYPSAHDRIHRPPPPQWIPTDRTVNHAERCRGYTLANPILFKYVAKGDRDWRLSKDQMWWYEREYEEHRDRKQLNIFLSELPADDEEAFQSEAITVIDQEIIQSYRDRVREPWRVFTILGQDIPVSLTVPRREWIDQPPVFIRTGEVMKYAETFRLQPVRWDGYQSATDPALRLFVWEPPEDGEVYGIGVDTSDGIGEDGSVAEVLRKGSPFRVPAQVAEFQSPYIKAFQLWPMCLALGAWYSTYNVKAQRRVQCKIAIECRGNGEATQFELQKRGWVHFHAWKRYDSRKRIQDAKTVKIGIYTSEWWRSQMMDYILTLIDEESIELPSKYLVREAASIERELDQQKAQAAYGAHDDRFMALGFILFSLYVDDNHRTRYARKPPSLHLDGSEPISPSNSGYAIWTPGDQARSDLKGVLPGMPVERVGRGPLTLGQYRNPKLPAILR